MKISEMPRNKAKNPTNSSRSSPRAGNRCCETQKPSRSSRMPTTSPSHQLLLTPLVMMAVMRSSAPLKTSSSPSTEAMDQKASNGRTNAQIAPTTNRMPSRTCAHCQLWRTEAIMNSLSAASTNSTPSRTHTQEGAHGRERSGGEPQPPPRDDQPRDAGHQEQPPGAC